MSYKKRTKKEMENILREFASGVSLPDIAKKYGISQTGFYRLVLASRGLNPNAGVEQRRNRIKKLEKDLDARDKEIRLLKAILKKS